MKKLQNYTIEVRELFDGAIETSLFINDGETGDSELIGTSHTNDVVHGVECVLNYID